MIKVLWFNFSGGFSSSSMFPSFGESGMNLYVGDLVDKPESVGKINFENINHYSLGIKAIQLDKQPVPYSKALPEFHRLFGDTLKAGFDNAFCQGSHNLAITCQEGQLNVPEIVDKFLEQLTIKGYSFTCGELSEKKEDNLPLQFNNDTHSQFIHWLAENSASNLEGNLEEETAGLSL